MARGFDAVRRDVLRGGAALVAACVVERGAGAAADQGGTPAARGRLKQSVSRWCFGKWSLDELCAHAARIGYRGIDLLGPAEWPVVRKHGLVCPLGMLGGPLNIEKGFNRLEQHAAILEALGKGIDLAAEAGVPNLVCFSGNRAGMSDEEGLENCARGLGQIASHAERKGVTLCVELLNSKVDHKDYMCDHTAWGVELVRKVGSPRVKLLYDIYHMQIMEGDVIRTIRENDRLDRPLPHGRRAGPARDRRPPGAQLPGDLPRDRRHGLHRLPRPGVRAHGRAAARARGRVPDLRRVSGARCIRGARAPAEVSNPGRTRSGGCGPVVGLGRSAGRRHCLEPAVTASITRSRLKLPGF